MEGREGEGERTTGTESRDREQEHKREGGSSLPFLALDNDDDDRLLPRKNVTCEDAAPSERNGDLGQPKTASIAMETAAREREPCVPSVAPTTTNGR